MTYERYQRGDRIELISMNDLYTDLARGARGTVESWQADIGHLEVLWDSGSSLSVIPAAGDQVRPVGVNITYPPPQAPTREADLPAAASAFVTAIERLSNPVAVMTPVPQCTAWQELRTDRLLQFMGLCPVDIQAHTVGDDLQLIVTNELGFQLQYNALAARLSTFVGSHRLDCRSEAVLCGRGADGSIVAIPDRHRRPLAKWMLAAGFAPEALYVLSPTLPPVTAAGPRPDGTSS